MSAVSSQHGKLWHCAMGLWLARAQGTRREPRGFGCAEERRKGGEGGEDKGAKKLKGAEHKYEYLVRAPVLFLLLTRASQMVLVGAGQIKFSTFSLGGCHA